MTVAASDPLPQSPRARWQRIGVRLAACLALLAAAHWLILPAMGRFLVVQEAVDEPFDYLVVADGDRCHEQAVERLRQLPGGANARIVVVEWFPGRAEKLGVIPSFVDSTRNNLSRIDPAAAERLVVIPGGARNAWQEARLFDDWLRDKPQARVRLLCKRLTSRRWRYVLDRQLTDARAAQVHVEALDDRVEHERGWWRSKSSLKGVFNAYLQLAYDVCSGAPDPLPLELDPDRYEAEALP